MLVFSVAVFVVVVSVLFLQIRQGSEQLASTNNGQNPLYHEMEKSMNKSANPCTDFYNFVCGNWKSGDPSDEDMYDMLNRQVVNARTLDLQHTPIRQDQPRITDTVVAAFKMCLEVRYQQKDNLNDTKEYLEGMGLSTEHGAGNNANVFTVLMNLSLYHNLPVTLIFEPRVDLRDHKNMVLYISFGGPLIITWYQVRASMP